MKRFLLAICGVLAASAIFSQDLLHCGADELRISTLKQMPEVAKAVIERDNRLEAFTLKFCKENNRKDEASYVIPVVFHVIHNYGPENISSAQLADGIDVLNKTFRKLLADTATIVPEFKAIHADTKIEFRLASKDPAGNCHSGINRIASTLTTKGDHSVKSLIQWPPNKYLNIYVVANAAGLAGHCVWPADADTIPEWDGIVVGYNYVGSIGESDYTRSVALAHECGHYLNLHHIWGGNNVPNFYFLPCADPNKDCSIDDLVSDTPPTIGWQSCNLNGKSCGSALDNVQNVMDYSYCNRMFTFGQRDRMQACLNSPIAGRNNLWTPENLNSTGVLDPAPLCVADFSSDRTVVCADAGNEVIYTNTSFGGTITSASWVFPGGNPATSTDLNPVVAYSTPGEYDVSLAVSNGVDTVYTQRTNFISVLPSSGAPYPFNEGFESFNTLSGSGWITRSLDTTSQWEVVDGVSFSGQKSIKLNNFSDTNATLDYLFSKAIDLSAAPGTLKLTFRYAYAKRLTSDQSQLNIFFASNCNDGWQKRAQLSSLSLPTAPQTNSDFVPSGPAEWKQASVNITSTFFVSNFHFRFELVSNGGNNLYIDDINIDLTPSGLSEKEPIVSSLEVFPNPTKGLINLSFTTAKSGSLAISLRNVLGKEVLFFENQTLPEGEQVKQLDVGGLPSGMYFLILSNEDGVSTKPIVIQD